MTLSVAAREPSPLLRAVLAAARVVDVDEDDGFCASVYRNYGHLAVVRLGRSIRGAPHEGDVLRWAMEQTVGGPPGYYEYALTTDPVTQEDRALVPEIYRQ